MCTQDVALVTAPDALAVNFIKTLQIQKIPFALMVNNTRDYEEALKRGVERIIQVNTTKRRNWKFPEFPIGSVYIFEESLTLSCRYLQICRSWTSKPIYVITHHQHPNAIYKQIGANYVIYTHGKDVSFLLLDENKGGEAAK